MFKATLRSKDYPTTPKIIIKDIDFEFLISKIIQKFKEIGRKDDVAVIFENEKPINLILKTGEKFTLSY